MCAQMSKENLGFLTVNEKNKDTQLISHFNFYL